MKQPPPPGGGALLPLAGFAIAALGVLWLSGALGAALFGDGWISTPAPQLLATALRLPAHLGDPRAAWPAAMRHALPGAIGFYLALALILATLGEAIAAALRLAREKPWGALLKLGHKDSPASARWAAKRDLRALFVKEAQPGRVILGRAHRRLLAAEQRQSVIVVAPSQSGKTTALAIPALLEWPGPAVATSIKTDLVRDTMTARSKLGRAMVFDPARVTELARVKATPLNGCGSWRGAMRVAHWLSRAARPARAGIDDAEFWYAAAEKLLAPLLFAAASEPKKTIADVVRWLEEGEGATKEVEALLEGAGEGRSEARRSWRASLAREKRQRSSIQTTAETIVAAFADPHVAEETQHADYTPAALLHGNNTLYLCAPAHEQERLRPLFSMMIQELLAVVYESAAATGKPIDPPLLLVLDEAANIAPIPNLDEVAATGAGQGIQLLSVFQDLAQVRSRYGEQAQTIVNNHRAKLFGTGISDPETLDYATRVVGAGEFQERSHTSGEGHSSTTELSTYRQLTPANVVRETERGKALLIYGHLPPTKVELRSLQEVAGLKVSRDSGKLEQPVGSHKESAP